MHSHGSQRLMFQNLISFDVNEGFASIANPWRYLDEALHHPLLNSDTPAQMVVEIHSSLSFFHMLNTPMEFCPWVLTVHYGHHEYLPDLIITDTHTQLHNKGGETWYVHSWLAIHTSSKTLLMVGLIDKLISVLTIDQELKGVRAMMI